MTSTSHFYNAVYLDVLLCAETHWMLRNPGLYRSEKSWLKANEYQCYQMIYSPQQFYFQLCLILH